MIHVVKTTRRTCDRCREWIEYTDQGDELDVIQGWKTFGGDDLCPKCARSLELWWNGAQVDGTGGAQLTAESVVVWIDADEWFPCYDMAEENPRYGTKAVLSQEDYQFVKRVLAEFQQAQAILEAAEKAALSDGSR